MRCGYCNHGGNTHNQVCPVLIKENLASWKLGWNLGRTGKKLPEGATEIVQIGWVIGDCAADEAVN